MGQMVWFLFGLGLGLALDWVLVKVMLKSLKERVKALESVIELDSAQKMERVLALESRLRLESEKVQMSETAKEKALKKGWGWVLGQEQEQEN